MSPEQARGKPVDKRADIWAFGCVLYEILTGSRAFEGEDVSVTLANVINQQPDWKRLPDGMSDSLQVFLRRCLDKDPTRRVQAVGDMRLAMEGAFDVTLPDTPSAQPAGWFQPSRLAIGALVVGLIALSAALILGRRLDVRHGVTRVEISGAVASGVDLAVSADGSYFVFQDSNPENGEAQLYLRRLDQLDPQPLTDTRVFGGPFLSPDGQWVGFLSEIGRLEKLSIARGGGPQLLVVSPVSIAGASWGSSDQVVFGRRSAGLAGIAASGGEPLELTVLDTERSESSHRWPSFVPDRQVVLFASFAGPDLADAELAVLDLDSGVVSHLGVFGTSPRYVPTGHIVYASQRRELQAVPFSLDSLEVTGNPVTLAEDIVVRRDGAAGFRVSDTGRLIYTKGTSAPNITPGELYWVDRIGEASRIGLEEVKNLRANAYPRLLPSGNRLAALGEGGVTVVDLERGSDTRWPGIYPVWSADGSSITYTGGGSGSLDLFSRPADQSGPEELLVSAPGALIAGSWSPGGRDLAYYEVNPETGRDLWILSEDGTSSPFLVTEFNEKGPRFSPDGEWLAYVSDESGEDRVYAQPFPDGGAVVPISAGRGSEPVWSRDGSELFYRNDTHLMVVDVAAGNSRLEVSRPKALFEDRFARETRLYTSRANYDVSLDSQRFLMVKAAPLPAGGSAPVHITFVDNWFEELTRLVPVGQ